jgi:prepilin-type processing-associated H-X9-DG protein
MKKYVFFNGGVSANGRLLAPITYALETEMQGAQALWGPNGILGTNSYDVDTGLMLDPKGLNQYFICPAHATSPLDIQPMYEFLWVAPGSYVCQPQSYIFNEYILGFNDNFGLNYLKGKSSLIHKPGETMFCADGVGGSTTANHAGNHGLPNPIYTVYTNTGQGPVTLADALNAPAQGGTCGDSKNFDLLRHKGKMNIAFCDGHVEALNITTGDLAKVFILPP